VKFNQLLFSPLGFHQYIGKLNHLTPLVESRLLCHEKYLSTDMFKKSKTVQILNTQHQLPSGNYMHFFLSSSTMQ